MGDEDNGAQVLPDKSSVQSARILGVYYTNEGGGDIVHDGQDRENIQSSGDKHGTTGSAQESNLSFLLRTLLKVERSL